MRLPSNSLPSWEFVELLGHIDSCLSSNLGGSSLSPLQIVSLLPPPPRSSPGTSVVHVCVSALTGAPSISEAVLISFFFFLSVLKTE